MLKELSSGDKVCRIKRALYGLKQAGYVWHKRLYEELRKIGAEPTKSDSCINLKKNERTTVVIVIYVDDILIMCADNAEILCVGKSLSKIFEMKDVGELQRCLGMEFVINNTGIQINHKTYIDEILRRFGMFDCNPVSTPLDLGLELIKGKVCQKTDGAKPPYRELVGCLLYLSVSTRPDIAHAASVLGQFNDCFNKSHWSAAKRVLRYLKGTSEIGLFYESGNADLKGYVDADWVGSISDRRSFTGFLFMLSGGPIVWDSRKQRTVALSTTEDEYMVLAVAAKEIIHLRRFLVELGVPNIK